MELRDDALRHRLETEQQQLQDAETDIRHLKQEQYKKGQMLFEEKRREADCISGISGIAAQDRNLRCKVMTLEEQVYLFSLRDLELM